MTRYFRSSDGKQIVADENPDLSWYEHKAAHEVVVIQRERFENDAQLSRARSLAQESDKYGRVLIEGLIGRVYLAERERDEAVSARNYAMSQREEERRAKEGNLRVLNDTTEKLLAAEYEIASLKGANFFDLGILKEKAEKATAERDAARTKVAKLDDMLSAIQAVLDEREYK